MLGFMLDRLSALHVDHLVVATSDLPQDDAVAEVATAKGVAAVRGSESDVLDRYVTALARYPADVVVRLTADCPLSDPTVIHAAIDLRAAQHAAYASNSLVRTFPVGLDVEVMTASALKEAGAEASDSPEREHVTPFIYRRPERYKLVALVGPEPLGGEWWTVDTAADLERVRGIVSRLDDPMTADWRRMLEVAGRQAADEPAGIAMRPAISTDDDTVARLSRDPATVALGQGGDARPVASDLLDAGRRTWIMALDGAPVAWVQIAVRTGVGRLTGRARGDVADRVIDRLRVALSTDYQVREWDGPTALALRGERADRGT